MGSVHSSGQNGPAKSLLLPHPRVRIGKGLIEGFRHQLADGRPIDVFLGIPFAKPPIGQLRFKKPVEPNCWHPTVWMAKKYPARSVQMNFVHTDVAERRAGKSEDCLYLNIITPGWRGKGEEEGKGFPVMFYIHGGAYLIDSTVKYHHRRVARTLVHHGVVVVIIQYRLGLLGFFTTGDAICPGNFGLWDQLMALRWTKENIAAFGGDPNRVTVFGQSAGAASADLLAISPISRDLFSQSILMGGNAECSWAVLAKKPAMVYCRKWALKMGFKCAKSVDADWNGEENVGMVEFLRGLPAGKFEVNLLGVMGEMFDTMRLPLGPVVDGELIPYPPKLLRSECPPKKAIAGICKHEGMLFLALAMKRPNAKLLAKLEGQMMELVEEWKKKEEEKKKKREKGNGNGEENEDDSAMRMIDPEHFSKLYGLSDGMHANKMAIEKSCVMLLSDFIANLGLHNFCAHSLATGSTVFRYIFEHFNPDNTRALNPFMPFKGATHSTELAFVFDANMFVLPWSRTKADKQVRKFWKKSSIEGGGGIIAWHYFVRGEFV